MSSSNATQPVAGNTLAGIWKLISYSRRFLDTGEVRSNMLPDAYIMYSPGGYMMSVTVEENRPPPAGPVITDEECVRLFRTIVSAYAGTYELNSGEVTHHVEYSWNQLWTGTDQKRFCAIDGDTLTLTTSPRTTGTDTRQFVNTLTWELVEAFLPAASQKS